MGGVVGSSSTGCLRVKKYEQQIMMQASSCQPDKTFCTLVRLGLSHSGLETSWQPVVEKVEKLGFLNRLVNGCWGLLAVAR